MKMKKQQHGVVLLSCLVFLLLLLIFLRFTMSSALMEERKVGADIDNMNAQSAAKMVMKDAEMDIMRIDAQTGDPLAGSNKNKAFGYWNSLDVNTRVGVFDGDAAGTGCTPSYNCKGFRWTTNQCGNSTNTICYGDQTNAIAKAINGKGVSSRVNNNLIGKYIIERFRGNGSVLNMGTADKNVIILRVTAVGFSKPTSRSDNSSNVVLQNTYILTRR